MGQTVNPRLRRVLMEIVENHIRDNAPPETAETLARLIDEGYSRERAMELIACVVTSEVFDILKNNEVYNEIRYAAGLLALPQPPWEGEEDVE